jgi:hypothetical protein
MALCTDKSLTYLNDLGYNVVRLPRKGLDPLDVLGRDGRSLERLGRLDQLWRSRKPLPEIGAPQPAAYVNGQATSEMSASMGLRVLNGVLKAIGAELPELSFAYKQADTLQFTFGDVAARSVIPLEVGNFLSEGDIHNANPFVERYFADEDTDAFIVTEVLQSTEITVSAKDQHGGTVKVDIPAMQAILGGGVSISAKDSAGTKVTYKGKEAVTFGFKVFAIAFDGRWRIAGVLPSPDLAFSAGAATVVAGNQPVILRHGTLVLKSI